MSYLTLVLLVHFIISQNGRGKTIFYIYLWETNQNYDKNIFMLTIIRNYKKILKIYSIKICFNGLY